jgi:hypothetical protein
MEDTKDNLLSLSSDLRRIALLIHRGSSALASRFCEEASNYFVKIKINDSSWQKLLRRVNFSLKAPNSLQKAEDCLMYSVLLQNRAMKM